MKTQNVEIEGIELIVFFDYERGMLSGDYDTPDDPNEVTIHEVFCYDVDILPLLSSGALAEIESQIHESQS